MIRLYCRKKHRSKDGLCEECRERYEYVGQRRMHCPFGDKKTFCSNCKIQCYKPSMKEKIRVVMKYSGPRLLFYNPKLVQAHVRETVKMKRESRKTERKKAEKGYENQSAKTENQYGGCGRNNIFEMAATDLRQRECMRKYRRR